MLVSIRLVVNDEAGSGPVLKGFILGNLFFIFMYPPIVEVRDFDQTYQEITIFIRSYFVTNRIISINA